MKKRGSTLLLSTIIFLVLNLLIFTTVFLFVRNIGNGSLVYEQGYAKTIALAIDKARPGMEINLSFSKGVEIAEKNKISEEGMKNLVRVDNQKNKVLVSLSSRSMYSMEFFTDYYIETEIKKDRLILRVKENEK